MSDLCENVLTVTGAREALLAFQKKAAGRKSIFDINALCPTQEWDIQWHAHNVMECHKLKKDGNISTLGYEFDTELEPPIALFCKVAKAFPALTFELAYEHPLHGFKGLAVFKNGKVDDRRERWSDEAGAEAEAEALSSDDLGDDWGDHVREELSEEAQLRDDTL
jgi:hypothetical protein